MNEKEYYSRMEKIDGKISTDRCSFDEVHNLTIQKNYLNKQYIKYLEHNWNELKKYLEENKYFYSGYQGEDLEEDISIIGVLNKMQELESDKDV